MAIYDARKLANETIFEVAKLCAMAALKAPQITGRTEIKGEIVTGEDLLPIMEYMGIQGEVGAVAQQDFLTLKKAYEAGTPPVLLFLGAELGRSELGWNCYACGFATCAEFNRYSKKMRDAATLVSTGPTCLWKGLDFGIAADWAAATAWALNVDNRLQQGVANAARRLGHLQGCSRGVALSIGPCGDLVWFSRPALKGVASEEELMDYLWSNLPHHWMGRPYGDAESPIFKYADDWQLRPKRMELVEPSPEILEKKRSVEERLAALIQRERAKRGLKGTVPTKGLLEAEEGG